METKMFVVASPELDSLREIAKRLYSQNHLSGDDMRDLAQRLDGILRSAVPLEEESEGT